MPSFDNPSSVVLTLEAPSLDAIGRALQHTLGPTPRDGPQSPLVTRSLVPPPHPQSLHRRPCQTPLLLRLPRRRRH